MTSMEDVIELSSASDGEEALPVKYERNKRFRIIWRIATRMISTKMASESGTFPYNGLRHLLVIIKEKTHDIKNVQLKEFIFRKLLHFFEAVKFAYRGIGEDEKFNFLLVEFMALYTNLICEQFKQLSEDSTAVSNLLTALHIIFSGKSHFTILTLLKTTPNVVLHPIYKKYLLDRKLHDGYTMIRYIPLVLCYRQWKKIASDHKTVAEIDINCMLKGVLPRRVPPVDDMNQCFTRISDLVGFAIQNGDKGTSILLENESMDLDESIDKYFKQYGQYIARHCSYKLLETTQNITLGDKLVVSNTAYPPSNTTNAGLRKSSDKESNRAAASSVPHDSSSFTAFSRRKIEHIYSASTMTHNTTTMDSKCDTKLSNQSQTSFRCKQSLPRNRDNLRGTSRGISRTSTTRGISRMSTSLFNSPVNRLKPANSGDVIVIDSSSSSDEDETTNESPEGEVSSTTNWDDDRQSVNHAKELNAISQTLSTNSTTTTTTSPLPRFNIENSSSSNRIKERRDQYFSAEVSSSAIDCTNFELSKTYESVSSPKVSSDTPQECLGNTESSIAGDSNPIAPSICPDNVSKFNDQDELVDNNPFRVVHPFKEFYGVLLGRSQESDELSSPAKTKDMIEASVSDEKKRNSADKSSESSCSLEYKEEMSQATILNVVCEKISEVLPSVEDMCSEDSSLVEGGIQRNLNESCLSSDFSCDVFFKPTKMNAKYQGTLMERRSDLTLICNLSEKLGEECLHRYKMHRYLSCLLSAFNRFGSFRVDFPASRISPSSGYALPLVNENSDFYNSRLFYEETTVARNSCRQLVESGYFRNYFPSIASCSDDANLSLSNISSGTSKIIIDWNQIPDKSIHFSWLVEDGNGFSTTVGLTLKLTQENDNFDSSISPPTLDRTTGISSRWALSSLNSRFRQLPLRLPSRRPEIQPNRALMSRHILNYRMLNFLMLHNDLTTVQRLNLISKHDYNMRTLRNFHQRKMLAQKPFNPQIPGSGSSNGFNKTSEIFISVPRNLKVPLETHHATLSYPFRAQVLQSKFKPLKPLIVKNPNTVKDKKTDEKLRKRTYAEQADTPSIPVKKPVAIIAPTFIDISQEEFRNDRPPKEIVYTSDSLKRRKVFKENKINTTATPPREIIHTDFESILNDKEKTRHFTTPCYVTINSKILRRSLLCEKRKSAIVNEKRKADAMDLSKELEGGKKRKHERVLLQNASHKYTEGVTLGVQLNGKRKFETAEPTKEHESGRKKKNHAVAKSNERSTVQNTKSKNDTWHNENSMLRNDLSAMNLNKLTSEIDMLLKALTSLKKKPSVEAYFLLNKMVVTFLFECLSSRDCARTTYGRKYTSFCTTAKQLQANNVDNVELSKIKEKYVELMRNTKSLESLSIIRLLDETLGRLEAIKSNLFTDEWLQRHTSQIQRHKRTVPIERTFNIKDQNTRVLGEKCESDYDIPETESQSPKVVGGEDDVYENNETEILEQHDISEEEEVSKSPVQFEAVASSSENLYSEQLLHVDRQLECEPSAATKDDISDVTLADYFDLNMGDSNLDDMPYVPSVDPIDMLPQKNTVNGPDINLYNEIEVESHVSDDVNNLFAQHGQSSWQMYCEKPSVHESDGLIGTGAGTCDDDEEFREFKEYATKTYFRSRLMSNSRDDNVTFDAFLENGENNKNSMARIASVTSREHAYMRQGQFENRFHISLESDNNHIDFSRSNRQNFSPIESDESSRDDTEVDAVSYDVVS